MLDVSQCQMFLGMKLHAVVLAIATGVPSLALEYRPKLRDFMESISASDAVIRFDELTSSHFPDLVESFSTVSDDKARTQWDGVRAMAGRFEAYAEGVRRRVTDALRSPS
jgi:polysaccharide pyruvyl transferase WcaK-like protein